jgi:hypothetical protein
MEPAPLTAVPDPHPAGERRTAAGPLVPAPGDDMVLMPRHVADAAYHVLHAIHALKDDGAHQLFSALGKALNRGSHHIDRNDLTPCEVCHVQVGQGFPHRVDCRSDEAVHLRSLPVPQLDPFD